MALLHHKTPSRRGHVLVFFALILMAIMAMGALVVDLGIARLTQRQMQSATDSASAEALRHRDALAPELQGDSTANPRLRAVELVCGQRPPLPVDLSNPAWVTWLDCARRQLAIGMVDVTFQNSDDFFAGGEIQRGAGPVLEFTGGIPLDPGVTDYVASQLMTVPDNFAYKPVLNPNLNDDWAVPDMAAGRFPNTTDESPEFEPGGKPDNSFRVQLRRSADNPDPAGGPLPYLFGRGNLLDMNRNARGVTVRGKSIAGAGAVTTPGSGSYSAGRAKAVGLPIVNRAVLVPVLIPGLAPFSLTVTGTHWNDPTWHEEDLEVDATTGELRLDGNPAGSTREIGSVSILEIGSPAPRAGGDAGPLSAVSAANRTLYVYVPITDTIGTGGERVIGFGNVEWAFNELTGTLHISRPWNAATQTVVERIGNGNVCGTFPPANAPMPLTSTEVADLFQKHDSLLAPLLAPVGVR